MTTSTNLPVVATVEFHGTQLITIKKDEHELVAMKPVVEGIGLAWQKQHEKLSRDKDKFSYHLMVTTGKDGKKYEMSCIPLTKLNGWLFSINPNKIPNLDVRKRVVEYQEECFIALYDYWHKGKAERTAPETLTPSEQHEVSHAVKIKSAGSGRAIAEIWSRVKNKFHVAKYDQIDREHFKAVLEYISGMELKSDNPTHMIPSELIELGRLRAEIQALEMHNKYLQKSNDTYIGLHREMLDITLDVLCPNRKKLTA